MVRAGTAKSARLSSLRRDNHDAQAMYLKLGFDVEGVLCDEYCAAGRWFDMVRMAMMRG